MEKPADKNEVKKKKLVHTKSRKIIPFWNSNT